jgi:hypothetical protein
MQSRAPTALATVAVLVASCAPRAGDSGAALSAPPRQSLAGRLVLPPGEGLRGVDVELRFATDGGGTVTKWALPDAGGRFARAVDDWPDSVVVTAGSGFEVLELRAEALPQPDAAGIIDLGEIDLRRSLTSHTLQLEPAPGAALGEVRVAMWSGPPPPGVALGSRQFPPVAVGSAREWLVPVDAEGIHFLVERPRDPDPAAPWWEGAQQRFGPFDSRSLPEALILD